MECFQVAPLSSLLYMNLRVLSMGDHWQVDDSLFVSFCKGWVFHEQEAKKEKTLDQSVL